MLLDTQTDYRVNLEVFEGPMDLLLYLIKKNDLSITDIPIAFILEEYLKYLDTLNELNIDLAGEFLLMAAELAYIKSCMLLPTEDGPKEDEEDPRADLVRRLLEYQQYKEAADKLLSFPLLGRDVFMPLGNTREGCEQDVKLGELIETDVYRLLDAFARMLIRLPKERFHDVAVDRISVNERIMELVGKINKGEVTSIEDLLPQVVTRYDLVVTFLALLEMARLKMIQVIQSNYNSTLYLKCIMERIKDGTIPTQVQY